MFLGGIRVKKILSGVLVLVLMMGLFCPAVAAEHPTVWLTLPEEEWEVGQTVALTVTVPAGTDHVVAYLSDNGKARVDCEQKVYDTALSKYRLTFGVDENGVAELTLTAKYVGVLKLTLLEVKLYTNETDYTRVDEVTLQKEIVPSIKRLYTKEDLLCVYENLSGRYRLMEDIAFQPEDFLEGGLFNPDGKGFRPFGYCNSQPFSGVFDGNGHVISGLSFEKAYYPYMGLFGVNTGTICRLAVTQVNVEATLGIYVPPASGNVDTSGSIDYESKDVWTPPVGRDDSDLSSYDCLGQSNALVGGLCGYNRGIIEECFVDGTVTGGRMTGGLCGCNMGVIRYSYAGATVSGEVAGGLTGAVLERATVADCQGQGTVKGDRYAGGLIGVNRGGILENAYFAGTLVGTAEESGAVSAHNEHAVQNNTYYLKDGRVDDDIATGLSESQLADLKFESDGWVQASYGPVLAVWQDKIGEIEHPKMPGDANGDGQVDTADLVLLKQFLAGLVDKERLSNGDLDGNGSVDTADLVRLKQALAGLLSL